ncbi:MAG TPA: sigma-70 family RNA polymerase sigma factor [Candidatus Acidoferrum sp.]|nr:sigma-70 family RNA polymerase sigma factor [Candidatus Acidoferrum sp.]
MTQMTSSVDSALLPDAVAVERTLAGDRDAYRILVERHSQYVYRLAYRMAGNPHDAEEIVQEAFLRGYQKLKQFAGQANFGTWVYRIAANYAIDRLRQRKVDDARREQPARDSEDGADSDPLARVSDAAPSPERLARSGQLARRMEQALQELTPAERTAIVMRHWDGCGIEEIAATLKSSTTAAKNTVFRAVQKLRIALEPFAEGRRAAKAMGSEI